MRISTRIMLAIIFSVGLTLIGITIVVTYEMNKTFSNNFAVSSKEQLKRMDVFVNAFFDTIGSTVSLLASLPLSDESIDALVKYADSPGSIKPASISSAEGLLTQRMQSIVDNFTMIAGMFVINTKGAFGTAPGMTFSPDFDARVGPWYTKAVDEQKMVLTSAFRSPDGTMICAMVSPIMSSIDTLLGVAGAAVALETITKEISGMRIGKTGYVIMLDAMGQVVGTSYVSDKTASESQSWLGKNIRDLPDGAATALTTLKNATVAEGGREVTIGGKVWLTATQKTYAGWTIIMLQERDEVFADAMRLSANVFIIGMSILSLMLFVAWVISIAMAMPIIILAHISRRVADGDLSAVPENKGMYKGELEVLYRSLKNMILKFVELISVANEKVREAEEAVSLSNSALGEAETAKQHAEHARREGILQTAEDISSAVSQLSMVTENLARELEQTGRLTDEQRKRVDSTVMAIGQMNVAVAEVAEGSARTANVADLAYHETQQGKLLVGNMVANMDKIEAQSLAMHESLAALNVQANSIDAIMSVIRDIADQTNLLALNAAIEAARAGDAGRGFAVVAGEVRKLAEKTMEATKSVNLSITAIQQSTRLNVNAMQVAATFVSKSTEVAAKAGEALVSIASMVDATANEIHTIASVSEEQAATTLEIHTGTQEVHQMMGEVAQATQRSNQAIAALLALSQQLDTIVHDLRQS